MSYFSRQTNNRDTKRFLNLSFVLFILGISAQVAWSQPIQSVQATFIFTASSMLQLPGADEVPIEEKEAIEVEEEEELPLNTTKAANTSKDSPNAKLPVEEEEELPFSKRPTDTPNPLNIPTTTSPNPLTVKPSTNQPASNVPASRGKILDQLLSNIGDHRELLSKEPLCDQVILKGSGNSTTKGDANTIYQIVRLSEWIGPPYRTSLEVKILKGEKGYVKTKLEGHRIFKIEYYEERMLAQAAKTMQLSVKELLDLTQIQTVKTSEKMEKVHQAIALIQKAITEHEHAIQQKVRIGNLWEKQIRFPLEQAFRHLELIQLMQLVKQGQTDLALQACAELLKRADVNEIEKRGVQQVYEAIYLSPAEVAFQQSQYAAARSLLLDFENQNPLSSSAIARKIQQQLMSQAQEKVRLAIVTNDPDEKRKFLFAAKQIWPNLPELQSHLRELQINQEVLECAYPVLPINFSPLTTQTYVERHASQLMFERLTAWNPQPEDGNDYTSNLIQTMPSHLPRGRIFQLKRTNWSDSNQQHSYPLSMEDVRSSLQLYQSQTPFIYPKCWGEMILGLDTAEIDHPLVISLKLRRDHWRPLAWMDFPILPRHHFPTYGSSAEELTQFNKQPIGSGPYQLAHQDANLIQFRQNPLVREDISPGIAEIVFRKTSRKSAMDRFLAGQSHIVYGLTTEEAIQLQSQGHSIEKIASPSVHFLAPNYRKGSVFQDADLRLAISQALNRSEILDTHFRRNTFQRSHHELTGPFPIDSWAYNRTVAKTNISKAKLLFDAAEKRLGGLPVLKITYSEQDPDADLAVAAIRDQLQSFGLKIELQPLDANTFLQRVYENHQFDLAYVRHDFTNDLFWLWPLVDPHATDKFESNYMGYLPEPDLRELFADCNLTKNFRTVQTQTQEIHKLIARKAIVIPLWQLDTYVAVSKSLKNVRIHPVHFFQYVHEWEFAKQAK